MALPWTVRWGVRHPPENPAGLALVEVTRLDGVKLLLEDGRRLIFRASGAKPTLQLCAEAGNPEQLDRVVKAGEALIGA